MTLCDRQKPVATFPTCRLLSSNRECDQRRQELELLLYGRKHRRYRDRTQARAPGTEKTASLDVYPRRALQPATLLL